ncbi:MAG: DUF1134 domain-containing protein [Desulfovibrionales bacterium]
MKRIITTLFVVCMLVLQPLTAIGGSDTYSRTEIQQEIEGFFETTTEGLADVIEKIFQEQGRPSGFIKGEEGGGAFVVGLRYGRGTLTLKNGSSRRVHWQGPSVGWDMGGNVSKVFTLVYNLTHPEVIYQRFPGVDGSVYVVGGFSMNYQQKGSIVLAPIRTGVGLRLGANVGYLHYTKKKRINPF